MVVVSHVSPFLQINHPWSQSRGKKTECKGVIMIRPTGRGSAITSAKNEIYAEVYEGLERTKQRRKTDEGDILNDV